jgi:cell surface protein SprA
MDYSHNFNLSYTVPLDKIPLTSWLTLNAKYNGSYNWQRAPLAQTDFGNIIQNNRSVNLTSQANFVTLYNKIPLFKRVLSDGRNNRGALNAKNDQGRNNNNGNKKVEEQPPKPPKPVEEMTKKERRKWEKVLRKYERMKRKQENEKKKVNPAVGFAARLLMSVRNVSGTYIIDDVTRIKSRIKNSWYE